MPKIIIFTDLDGTLLHPKTYSFEEALSALKIIKELGIPLILCSSKTRVEMEVYRERLDNSHPFVSENGGGIFIPRNYFKSVSKGVPSVCSSRHDIIAIGTPYEELRRAFLELKQRLNAKVIGFGDMTAREIAAISGLSEEEAVLAKEREFGEPFVFEGETDERFLEAIEEKGLHWTQGRFFHMVGNNDKGKAVKILKHLYEKEFGEIITIGLGDGFNDLPMLEEVDYPVLIPKEDGSYDPRVGIPNIKKAKGIGPSGWNEEVILAIKRLTTSQ